MERRISGGSVLIGWLVIGGIVALVAAALMVLIPIYVVWQQEKVGEAQLAKANQARQIVITQARAEEDAAAHRAKAIQIIGEMAKKYPEYRHQEFIGAFAEALKEGHISQIIYVPTEANMPIMEAGKRP